MRINFSIFLTLYKMKKILFLLICAFALVSKSFAQTLTCNNVTLEKGGDAKALTIILDSPADVAMLGFDIILPEGVEYAGSFEKGAILGEGFGPTVTPNEDGCNVLIMENTNNVFPEKSGVLIKVYIKATDEAEDGELIGSLNDIQVSDLTGEPVADFDDFDFDITIGSDEPQPEPWVDPEPLVGDVVTSVFYGANPVLINGNAHTSEGYPFYFDNGWKPADSSHALNNGALEINNPAEGNYMLMLADWFSVKEQYNYNVRVIYKSTAAGKVNLTMGSWGSNATVEDVAIEASDSWKELIVPFEAINFEVSDNTAHILLHCGGIVGTISIQSVEIYETEPAVPIPDPVWSNIVVNGNCATADNSAFSYKIKKQYYKAQIVDGDGVEGSRGVVVTSDDSPANDWDTQFFITINHKFAANEKFRLKMDYRADLEGDATATGQFQSHKACAAEMPEAGLTEADEVTDPSTQHIGTYIGNISGFSNLTFKNDWQTFEGEGIATADMQSICLNLSVKKESIKYYFDNIVVEIDENKATEDDMAVIREVANEGEDVVTGVKSLNTVEKNGAIYNLAGQKVDKNYKGIVIVNGKKMMMK